MKRLLILSLMVWSIASLCFAKGETRQSSHQLNWHAVQTIAEINKRVLSFDESFCVDNTFLPYFSVKIDLNSDESLDSVKIINPVFTDLSQEEKGAIQNNLANIEREIKIQSSYSIDRKIKKGIINILPLISSNGVLKKISQFTIQYQIKKEPNLRSTTSGSIHTFASNSVLKSGKWIKIGVSQSGIYKITYENLIAWGVSNPANANIFGYGGAMLPESFQESKFDDLPQISVWKEKGSDGVFGPGDYFLFYAQGPLSWKYDNSTKIFKRILNPYSFVGYYFISSDAGTEKLIQNKTAVSASATVTVNDYLDYQVHESETTNIISSGREWYGETYNNLGKNNFNFYFNDISTNKSAKIVVDAAAKANDSTFLNISTNNTYLGTLLFSKVDGHFDGAIGSNKSFSFTPTNSEIEINTSYYGSNGNAWLNYIYINAYRKLSLSESAQFFRCPDIVSSNQIANFQVEGSAGYQIWDITNTTNIQALPYNYSNNTYSFTDSANVLKEYVAVNPYASFQTPSIIESVTNQNLHASAQTDFVIIASPEYVSQAKTLAKKHEEADGISTLVLTPAQIFNEFSSGTPDATAFRWFMKMLYERGQSNNTMPKSLLLFGDGTYDNRTIYTKNSKSNKILTYQSTASLNEISSYVCDDYFGLLDDSDGGNINTNAMDIGVGRIPASTNEQATGIVEKICDYIDNSQNGYWKNILCYLADDITTEDNNDTLHIGQSNYLATYIENNHPNFQTKRIFLDSYSQEVQASGESYPLAKEKLFNLINSGVFLINYTGHGSTEGLANEKIISRSDVVDLYNKILPVFVTATCSFSRFDDTQSSSGEELFMNLHGGAIGLFTTTRTVYASSNYELNKSFNKFAFQIENGKALTLGEIMRRTKNYRSGDPNRLSFTLLADPALVLPIPTNKIQINEITSNANTAGDTIQALSTVTIKGQINDPNASKLTQFNGIITANIFDKTATTTTLANDGGKTYTYKDWKNMLFSGRAQVIDGNFTLSFIVPKDIAYNYGRGRINLYANDETNKLEANGYSSNIIVGGTKSDFLFENNGPQINMQLNSSAFRNGSKVDPSSVLFAQLSDENGINAGGYSIGHDITINISNDPNNSIVLNDYYQTNLNDFRAGTLEYKLPLLENGHYTLNLKAWDILNNSGENSISFKVDDSKAPEINNCYAVPNPATDYVRFVFKHDQPLSKLKMTVEIFNLNGELLWSFNNTDYFENNEAFIDWDLIDHSGKKISKGLYIYRINIESEEDGVIASEANKLLVK